MFAMLYIHAKKSYATMIKSRNVSLPMLEATSRGV